MGVSDLSQAMALAVDLCDAVEQPCVVAGALALAAHGYRRETQDVDIALAHGQAQALGRVDLHAGPVRVDVVTLDRDVPGLIADAVEEAVSSHRVVTIFDQDVYVVSLGHLIAMKLIAERKKDATDIVELIKARAELGLWDEDVRSVKDVLRCHLGWYACRVLDRLTAEAAREARL